MCDSHRWYSDNRLDGGARFYRVHAVGESPGSGPRNSLKRLRHLPPIRWQDDSTRWHRRLRPRPLPTQIREGIRSRGSPAGPENRGAPERLGVAPGLELVDAGSVGSGTGGAARVGAPPTVLGGRGRMTGSARDGMPAEWEETEPGWPTARDRTAVNRRAAAPCRGALQPVRTAWEPPTLSCRCLARVRSVGTCAVRPAWPPTRRGETGPRAFSAVRVAPSQGSAVGAATASARGPEPRSANAALRKGTDRWESYSHDDGSGHTSFGVPRRA
jgi:hypothetical protein